MSDAHEGLVKTRRGHWSI